MVVRLARRLAPLLLVAAVPALAESPFDGTWKGQLATAKIDAKPDEWLLNGGTYNCRTCLPPFQVKADGRFHAVAGRDYWDEIAVQVVDDHTVSLNFRKAGKVIGTGTVTASPDGRTLSISRSNTNNAAGVAVESTSSQTRIGAPVAGAHLISGSWQAAPATSVSDTGLVLTLRIADGVVHLTSPMGETLAARVGGPYAPNVGDPGKTMTKAEMPNATTLRLTDMRGGKVVNVTTYTVGADGRTIDGAWQDPRDGSKGTFQATRQ